MEFQIGDVVKHLFFENQTFIVTNVIDYSDDSDGNEAYCEVMDIYPITKMSKVRTLEASRLDLQSRKGTMKYEILMDFIRMERQKYGLVGKSDWEKAIEAKSKNKIKIVRVPMDVVEYDKLETIDDCLDALSGLMTLHTMFGDEAYLQLKEIVEKRLRELI